MADEETKQTGDGDQADGQGDVAPQSEAARLQGELRKAGAGQGVAEEAKAAGSESLAPAAVVEDAKKIRGANHREGCECRFCQKVRKNWLNGRHLRDELRKRGLDGMVPEALTRLKRTKFKKLLTDPNSPAFADPTRAALDAGIGYSPATAKRLGSVLAQHPDVTGRIHLAQSKAGITDDYLAGKLKEGLEATMVEVAKFEGKITDEKEYADHHARHKFLETAHRLRGELRSEDSGPKAALIFKIGAGPVDSDSWALGVQIEEGAASEVRESLQKEAAR